MRHNRRRWGVGAIGLGMLGCLVFAGTPVFGQKIVIQPIPFNNPTFAETPEDGPGFVTNRELSQRLRTARQRILEEDYVTAVRFLQSLLDEREDWFMERSPNAQEQPKVQDPANGERPANLLSLKNATEELVGSLPAPARRVYEQEFGPVAKDMLKAALGKGDLDKLNEIARRFFHTEAGYEAVYRLGLIKADHGEPFAAALHFQRLKAHSKAAEKFEPLLSLKLAMCWERAGLSAQSRAALIQLKRESPQGQIRLGDRTLPLFDREEDAEKWLVRTMGQMTSPAFAQAEEWPVFRGNTSRSATSAKASPVGPVAWSRSTLDGEETLGLDRGQKARIEEALHRLAEIRLDEKTLFPIPAAAPIVLGDRAIFRTLENIQALDLKTGEILWKTAQTDAMLRPALSHVSPLEDQLVQGNLRRPPDPRMNLNRPTSALDMFLTQRIWRDTTFALLSGDSQRVYAVEEVGLADGFHFVEGVQFAMANPNDPFVPKLHNKLMAFDLKSGLAEWEAGGPGLIKGDPLGGMFFLGPPLPIGEQLFCLGERNNEISLLALEASTGNLEWEQRLVSPAFGLYSNRERRVMGLSPAFGQGVLICPTASGAVVAVDVTRRMLLWAYEYESTQTEDSMVDLPWQRGGRIEFSHESVHPESRWADTVPVIAGGRILLTPSDSDELHCLELSTGKLEWITERGQGLYLAGVTDGLAIVVSRSQVRAYRLTDGQDAWPMPVSIPLPGGRGFIAEGHLHLPLATGEIGTVDLKQGHLIAKTPLPKGSKPGNLVAASGRVVFQSPDSVGAFLPWNQIMADLGAKMQSNPNAADALTLRGALRLHQGHDMEALADLRQAYELNPTEDTRSLIVSRVLEGLRTDPDRYLPYRDEVRKLIQSPEESLPFLMLTASSASTPEARLEAFRDSIKLARTLGGELELQKLGDSHQVRGDCWIKSRLDELASNAKPEELAQWDKLLEQELPKTLEGLPRESRLQVLSSLPRLASVERAELALMKDQAEGEAVLEKSLRLNRLRNSKNQGIPGEATLALAEMYMVQNRLEEAWPLIQDLSQKWPDAWREDFKDLKPPETAQWPEGKLEAHFRQRKVAVLPEVPITLGTVENSPYANWSFSIDQQSRRLLARDENGIERWHMDVSETNGPVLEFSDISLAISGHIGVLSFKTHFAVLDLLTRKHTAEVLWSESLMEGGVNLDELYRLQQFQRNRLIFGAGLPVVGNHIGWVTVLGEDLIVYQVGERITAADALTGKPRWIRESVRPQSRIYGDEHRLVVIAPDATSALILKTSDGEILKTRDLPEPGSHVAFDGMHLIAWITTKDQTALESRDLESGELRWKILTPSGTIADHIGTEELALFQPDGKLLVVSLTDGSQKVNAMLALGHSYQVHRLANCYLALPNRNNPNHGAMKNQNPFFPEEGTIPVDGLVRAFDRQSGQPLWKTQVDDQAIEHMPPYNSPVIVFNKRRQPGQGVGGFIENNPFRVKLLDTRTGDVVFQHNQLQNVSPWSLRIQPEKRTLAVTFFEGAIEVEAPKEPKDNPRS